MKSVWFHLTKIITQESNIPFIAQFLVRPPIGKYKQYFCLMKTYMHKYKSVKIENNLNASGSVCIDKILMSRQNVRFFPVFLALAHTWTHQYVFLFSKKHLYIYRYACWKFQKILNTNDTFCPNLGFIGKMTHFLQFYLLCLKIRFTNMSSCLFKTLP